MSWRQSLVLSTHYIRTFIIDVSNKLYIVLVYVVRTTEETVEKNAATLIKTALYSISAVPKLCGALPISA